MTRPWRYGVGGARESYTTENLARTQGISWRLKTATELTSVRSNSRWTSSQNPQDAQGSPLVEDVTIGAATATLRGGDLVLPVSSQL